jgi:hypothetical protein
MPGDLPLHAIVRVPRDDIGETGVSDLCDDAEAADYMAYHPVAGRCDRVIGRDSGDNLFVVRGNTYFYWDHETDELIELGDDPAKFVVGIDE